MRSQHDFVLPRSTTVNYGIESLRVMGPKIWNILPETLKVYINLNLKLNIGYQLTALVNYVKCISQMWDILIKVYNVIVFILF